MFETGDNDFTVLDHGMLPPQMAFLKLLDKWYIPLLYVIYHCMVYHMVYHIMLYHMVYHIYGISHSISHIGISHGNSYISYTV